MNEIILPDIKMIYDIRQEYRQDPISWSLAIALIHFIVTKFSSEAVILRQNAYIDDEETCMKLIINTEQGELFIAGTAKEVGNKVYIQTNRREIYSYYIVEGNSLFESIDDVVTEESFKHDVGLIKLIKNPSAETLKLFGVEWEVEEDEKEVTVKRELDKSKLDKAALRLYNSIFQ